MRSKSVIFRLLYSAFVEIREESYISKNAKSFHLADLFHNIPLKLEHARETEDFNEIVEWLINRAEEKNCEEWLSKKLESIQDLDSSYGGRYNSGEVGDKQ